MNRFCRAWSARSFLKRAQALAHAIAPGDIATQQQALSPVVLTLLCENGRPQPVSHPQVEVLADADLTWHFVARAKGRFVARLRAGDRLSPENICVLLRVLLGPAAGADLVYGDALLVDDAGRPSKPLLKPAFDPVLFAEIDYIGDFAVFRRERLLEQLEKEFDDEAASFRAVLDGYCERIDEYRILHLPYPLIATRAGPVRRTPRAKASSKRDGLAPPVNVIIPSRNGYELIRRTLTGVFEKTDYPALRVHVVDNGSDDAKVLDLYKEMSYRFSNFTYSVKMEPFNFSRSVNRGLSALPNGHVLLLNNDIEVIEPDWLKEMVACLSYDGVGIVGAKLLYPDERLQHAGVIVGMGQLASHWYYKLPRDTGGHFDRLKARNSMVCVTGAVMLISEACRQTVGLMDEENFAVAYNDVDYCMRAYRAGFRAVWTPYAEIIHHESVSRRKDRSRERRLQFGREKEALKRLHNTEVFEDPAYSPWLSKRPGRFRLRQHSGIPGPRTWWNQI
ncbi:hypothetical protein GCM10011316_20780 [Roseibium aquae]|uniref:GT2 family glycosyltransferase n=1 Tax=Roseibium aquae TaxID=1323746 RepID=A0A916TMA3_9HYPH|nr:glycosyltransferase [Roseibium aquae]GGB48491.1 hypothetical protein GCM10011316_20780 [Roseibium aquae]